MILSKNLHFLIEYTCLYPKNVVILRRICKSILQLTTILTLKTQHYEEIFHLRNCNVCSIKC